MTRLYPFLAAAVYVLYQADRNPGSFSFGDLWTVLAATLAGVGVVYGIAWLIFRDRTRGRLPALCAFLVVVWVFWFDPLALLLPRLLYPLTHVVLLLAVSASAALLVRWLASRPAVLGTAATFLTITGALLVARNVAGILLDLRAQRAAVAGSATVRHLARPIRGPVAVMPPVRDVYLIVLDEYASGQVLHELLGFDNRRFEDSLRALGFHVPKAVSSNYTETRFSLPSMLNAAYVTGVAQELPKGTPTSALVNHLLDRSRVARFLQARGYRYVVFPSFWWEMTRSNTIADSVVRVWDGFELGRELAGTEFRRALRGSTVIDYLHRDDPYDRAFIQRTLEGVARLPSVRAPVFAFAHLLSPHTPFVFDRACGLPPRYVEGRIRTADYLGQLQCLNRMLLATVTRLIQDSEVPPVIVLQGDHGSSMLRFWAEPSAEQVPAGAAWERFGTFGAYYLPDGGAADVGDSITVVNVLGHVLRRYFDADLAPLPDEWHLSIEAVPNHFVQVDPAWLSAGRPDRPLDRARTHR